MNTFAEIEYAPVNDKGNHTSYGLYILADDPSIKKVFPFPRENYEITTAEHKEEIKKICKEKGFELVLE